MSVANVFTVDAQQYPYECPPSQIAVEYRYRSGQVVVPVASGAVPPPPPEIVTVHGPITYALLSFTLVRLGKKPVLPAPYIPGIGVTLLDARISALARVILADGNPGWSRSGTYVFALQQPLLPGSNALPCPDLPVLANGLANLAPTITIDEFVNNLLS